MTPLELKIYAIVRTIPAGKVATYGQIATLAGNEHLARVVGNVMHKNPVPFLELARKVGFCDGKDMLSTQTAVPVDFAPVPCHRVVASSGRMGANFGLGGPAIQAAMLRAEGVEVSEGIVDLAKFGM